MAIQIKAKARVTFIHPDLGIGGAERLIVDAAVGLKHRGYDVAIITGYHDPGHSFPETNDGTLKVTTVGSFLPRSIFGRFVAVCAYIKMVYAAMYLTISSIFNSAKKPNVVICDQVSACIPFLMIPFLPKPKVMFYCHYPDQLLTTRESFLKAMYRKPLDWFEEITTGMAHKIVVNSQFTRGVFQKTFKRIRRVPEVLYPSINAPLVDSIMSKNENGSGDSSTTIPIYKYLFLSINRFETKKNVGLAIRAMRKLKTCVDEAEWKETHLVLAGGYDPRLPDSVTYLNELKKLCKEEKLEDYVTFMLSPSDSVKMALLSQCTALIYTPSNEHFGIVPLEAMYVGKPVIAVDSGGPRETVVNETTGFLSPSNENHFASCMARLVKEWDLADKLGSAGKRRFRDHFSFKAFSYAWDQAIEDLSVPSESSDHED